MQPSRETEPTDARLAAARRRADDLQPFSPAWDAAMSWVEDLEREGTTRTPAPTEVDEA
jgi:hypothetical protein